jgi:solute carrier family 13 (sodium-dependent dicarboxylate transporter), member 2/3/5
MHFHPKRLGLALGPLLFLMAIWLQPLHLKPGCNEVLGTAAWMIIWWVFECVPLAVTALLPIVLLSVTGVMKLEAVLVSYSEKNIYLFLGGFILALGLEAHGLHKRIALAIIRAVGLSPIRLLLGFLLATASLSMWISNTATAVMMLPMAMSCLSLLYQSDNEAGASELGKADKNFAAALMLVIAYGASIGGMATIIGTPPNLFTRGFLADVLKIEVTFFQWAAIAVPIVVALLLSTHIILAYFLFPCASLSLSRAEQVFERERRDLGAMKPVHYRMLTVFVITALLWMTSSFVRQYLPTLALTGQRLPLTDEVIAIVAAISLFLIPGDQPGKALLDWEATRRLPWGILLLFGGGIALAKSLEQTGLLEALSSLIHQTAGDRPFLLLVLLTALCLYLTEVMSNIALVQVMIPLICAIATSMGQPPIYYALPATLAASCAFMLPMATPPNGIVFGSGKLTVWDMIKAGFWLNLISLSIILLMAPPLIRWFAPI